MGIPYSRKRDIRRVNAGLNLKYFFREKRRKWKNENGKSVDFGSIVPVVRILGFSS
jgi:hypothetical protein